MHLQVKMYGLKGVLHDSLTPTASTVRFFYFGFFILFYFAEVGLKRQRVDMKGWRVEGGWGA